MFLGLGKLLICYCFMPFSISMGHDFLEARVVTFEHSRAQYTCHSVWSFIFFQPLSNTMSIQISLFEPALLKVCLPVRHDCQFNTLHPPNRCLDHSRKRNSTVTINRTATKQSNRLNYSLAVVQYNLINKYSLPEDIYRNFCI